MSKHTNNGNCPRCEEIFDRYAGFNAHLKEWFKGVQAKHPEAHISCAGRGRADQEECVAKHVSRAHYGQSAHNYNMAIDFFVNNGHDIYDLHWFHTVLAPLIPAELNWYGAPHAPYPELPHVEVRDWRTHAGRKLVE